MALEISYLSERVGWVQFNRHGRIHFRFDEKFLEQDNPPDGQPVVSFCHRGPHFRRPGVIREACPPFFSNLLPEGFLRVLSAKAGKVAESDEYGLLRVLGSDLPGAVTAEEVPSPAAHELEPPPASDISPGAWRFSLAGVQFKLSAIVDEEGGVTVPAQGVGGDWIVKFPGRSLGDVVLNEFAMMALASRIGIPIPETRLVPVNEIANLLPGLDYGDGEALLSRRFDRPKDGGKVHMEDFAQALGQFPYQKYERYSYANIASVLAARTGREAALDFTRRVVFSSLIGNGDLHLKNVSLLYENPSKPTLSPAYDLLCTRAHIANDALALEFGGSKGIDGLEPSRVRRYAQAAGLDVKAVSAVVGETVERTVEAWHSLPERDLLPQDMDAKIGQHLNAAARRTREKAPKVEAKPKARLDGNVSEGPDPSP